MAHSKSSTRANPQAAASHGIQAHGTDSGSAAPMRSRPAAHGTAADGTQAQAWLQQMLPDTQKALDALVHMQQQWLETLAQGSEPLAEQFKTLQQARHPAELVSAQMSVLSQQFEQMASQYTALMQQLHEAQLLWLGQWDEKHESAAAAEDKAGNALLKAWGQAQDEWLRMTRSWIDAANPGSTHH